MEAGLYIVGTPIGNLGDMTFRAVETLKGSNLIIAEDTRQTRKLLTHFEISTHCSSCHKFNEAQRCGEIIERIRGGEAVSLVTDSGMPCISDPGARVVAACRAEGLPVTAVPGPAAVTTAVALSGFGGDAFIFLGFPPRKSGARQRLLKTCREACVPLVFYESPYRILRLLDDVEAVFGGERTCFLARELTKKFEELLSGGAAEIRQHFRDRAVKGECVLVIAPAR